MVSIINYSKFLFIILKFNYIDIFYTVLVFIEELDNYYIKKNIKFSF